jgi:MYXO-CTERM domain-containing protein
MRLLPVGVLLAAATTILSASPASAYVRYKTAGGQGFFWARTTVAITVYPNDFVQPTMTSDQVIAAATGAAAAWSSEVNPCTYLDLVVSASTGPTPVPANDARNTLIFGSTNWCQLAPDGTCEVDYDPSALAFTTDTANKNSGQIYDSDIQINAVDYTWADVDPDGGPSLDMDLQNALTHEMGHLIGLDHTCYDSTSGVAQPYDAAGQPVPACPASPEVQATTMYPSANPGDTQKRTLAPDDQAGVCGIYPVGDPPAPPGSDGCACAVTSAPRGGAPSWAALTLLVAILVRRRRGSRR